MKLTEKTFAVLKNFSSINPGLIFKPGNVMRTVSKEQNILAQAEIDNDFDNDFAIYDLNKFLSVVSFMEDPEINVNVDTRSLDISDGKSNTIYRLTDPVMVVSPPEENLELNNPTINFTLTPDDFSRVIRMGGVLGLPNVVVRGNRNKISIAAIDVRNEDSDVYSIDVGETTAEFQSIFKYENLKMIPDIYSVSITVDGIAQFVNNDKSLQYWIATEAGSTYTE